MTKEKRIEHTITLIGIEWSEERANLRGANSVFREHSETSSIFYSISISIWLAKNFLVKLKELWICGTSR